MSGLFKRLTSLCFGGSLKTSAPLNDEPVTAHVKGLLQIISSSDFAISPLLPQ